MNSIVENILMHYGMPRRSGRYPYGSGENPYQHSGDFLSRVQELKKSGMSETDIAKNMGLTTTQLRTQMSLAIVIGYNEMIMGQLEHSADKPDKKKEKEKIEPRRFI